MREQRRNRVSGFVLLKSEAKNPVSASTWIVLASELVVLLTPLFILRTYATVTIGGWCVTSKVSLLRSNILAASRTLQQKYASCVSPNTKTIKMSIYLSGTDILVSSLMPQNNFNCLQHDLKIKRQRPILNID